MCLFADSLSVTSGLAVALAVVFLIITAGIAMFKIVSGSVPMPRLLPDIVDINSVWNLFTAVPVLVTAYICHFNGKPSASHVNNQMIHISQVASHVNNWGSFFMCSAFYW